MRFPRASSLPHNGFKYKYEFPRENALRRSEQAEERASGGASELMKTSGGFA